MIDIIRHAMNGAQERELSLAELSRWAVRNQVADALPEAVLRRSLGLRAEKSAPYTVKATSYRENRPPPAY